MNLLKTLCALALLSVSAGLHAELVVDDAWVRGLPPGVANTAAYMTLRNTGNEDVVLTGATSPIAGSVQLHDTMDHGGMLHMAHVESLTVPAGGEVKLASGGLHLMLMELTAMPAPDSNVELTLQFSDGTSQALVLPVRSVLDE
ncbi:MAG: copper chaperone PCu(A)C [Gammaproteobacteria bacterium]